MRETTLLRRIAQWRQHSLFWPVTIILALLLMVQLVRLVLLLMTPVTPLGDWQPRQAQAMPMAAREAVLTGFNPFNRSRSASGDSGTATVTSLDLVLYGIRINAASGGGSAILAGSDGVQTSFSVGEEVLPGVTLAAVEFDHVLLDRDGKRESVFLDQSGDITPVSPQPSDSDDAAAPASSTASQAEASTASIGDIDVALDPTIDFDLRMEGNQVTGIEVSPQGEGTAFKKFGFQPGDVIVEYDGRAVRSADDVRTIVAKSRPGGRFSVMVERGGDILPIAIIVPEQ
ncbi:MAG: type II secretion system protein N [Pseudomonadota bacterium]